MRISDWSSDVCSSDLREFAADEAAVLGDLGRVVAARHIDLDIGEAMFVEMRAELLLGLGARLVGDEAQVELGDRAAGQDRQIGRASCRERVCHTGRSRWSPLY